MVWRDERVALAGGIVHSIISYYFTIHTMIFLSSTHHIIINNNAICYALHHHVPRMGAGSTRSHFSHHDFGATGCSISVNETTAIVVSSLDRCQPIVNSEYLKQKAPYGRIMRKS